MEERENVKGCFLGEFLGKKIWGELFWEMKRGVTKMEEENGEMRWGRGRRGDKIGDRFSESYFEQSAPPGIPPGWN